ncbi:MAG: sugar ABC transporter permease [Spirochaetaceae bacterium]|jgi:ABC-type sugar transport system permease subunit|nr:sugar ABC transporter permease [Spirochaetaceae bacterium]
MSIKSKKSLPYLLLLPFLILFGIFYLYPVLVGFVISFTKSNAFGIQEFKGIKNYVNMITKDVYFQIGLKNALLLLLFGGVLPHLIALPAAALLNNKLFSQRFKTGSKALLLIPYMFSGIGLVILFYFITWDPEVVGSSALTQKILDIIPLNDSNSVMTLLLNWKFIGWNVLLYYTGLLGIPQEYYENASIDGAGAIKKFFKISLPLLVPVILFASTITVLYCLQLFDEPFVYNGGYMRFAQARESLTPAYYIMYLAFGPGGRFGKASAGTWILISIILAIVGSMRLMTRKKELN